MKPNEVVHHESMAALVLPRYGDTSTLHDYALEAYHQLNGGELEHIVQTAAAMRQRYLADLDRAGEEGFRSFVGTREVARMSALVEKILPRITLLRDEAYRVARARLYFETGRLVELAPYSDPASFTAAAGAPAPAPEVTQADEPVTATAPAETGQAVKPFATKRDIKAVLDQLHRKGVLGRDLRKLQHRSKAGNVTLEQLHHWADELVQQTAGTPAGV
jgi:hypothetical protein